MCLEKSLVSALLLVVFSLMAHGLPMTHPGTDPLAQRNFRLFHDYPREWNFYPTWSIPFVTKFPSVTSIFEEERNKPISLKKRIENLEKNQLEIIQTLKELTAVKKNGDSCCGKQPDSKIEVPQQPIIPETGENSINKKKNHMDETKKPLVEESDESVIINSASDNTVRKPVIEDVGEVTTKPVTEEIKLEDKEKIENPTESIPVTNSSSADLKKENFEGSHGEGKVNIPKGEKKDAADSPDAEKSEPVVKQEERVFGKIASVDEEVGPEEMEGIISETIF